MNVLFVLGTCIGLSVYAFATVSSSSSENDVYYPAENWSDAFDWRLFKEFSTNVHKRNVLISPVSLKIILTLLYQGATGSTKRELESVLQFANRNASTEQYRHIISALQPKDTEDYTLNSGTRMFLDTQIEPKESFSNVIHDIFNADISRTNFSDTTNASRSVNSWIGKLTNGKISKLVSPGDMENAVMVLTNAIYFKGSWLYQFPKKLTHDAKFNVPSGDDLLTIVTPFITTTGQFYYLESSNLDVKIIRLPYKGARFSMFVLLPNSIGGLDSFLKHVNMFSLKSLLYLMDLRTVKVSLPKFKFEYQVRYNKALREFGLTQMFQNTASFPGIVKGNTTLLRQLVVTDIIQKTGIEIDEEGSVVHSASGITFGNKMGEEPDLEFNARHPFMFFIEDESTGTILFVGKMENPLDEELVPLNNKKGDD